MSSRPPKKLFWIWRILCYIMPFMETLIEMQNVYKSYGPKHVLKDFSLRIGKGESVVMLGASGTGKSISTRIMLGLEKPDRGRVLLYDEDIAHCSEEEVFRLTRKIGMLFQNSALFDSLNVWENVAFPLVHKEGMDAVSARKKAVEKLAAVGLSASVADLMPSELSGGMKKRVGLARAIAIDPEIIFFDEPTTGLDPVMGNVINDLIVKSVKSLGATAFTITHDIASATRIASRVVMLHDGRIVWEGAPKDLKEPKNKVVAEFVASAAIG